MARQRCVGAQKRGLVSQNHAHRFFAFFFAVSYFSACFESETDPFSGFLSPAPPPSIQAATAVKTKLESYQQRSQYIKTRLAEKASAAAHGVGIRSQPFQKEPISPSDHLSPRGDDVSPKSSTYVFFCEHGNPERSAKKAQNANFSFPPISPSTLLPPLLPPMTLV